MRGKLAMLAIAMTLPAILRPPKPAYAAAAVVVAVTPAAIHAEGTGLPFGLF